MFKTANRSKGFTSSNSVRGNLAGFTLIELLVVISIVGFLLSAAVYTFNIVRTKSRDAQRLEGITQLQKAIELYYHDHSSYPPVSFAYTTADYCGHNWCKLETFLKPYLEKLPRDPSGPQVYYKFGYEANSGDNYATYGLKVRMEYKENFHFAQNDGGSSQYFYEIGIQPRYCTDKYSSPGHIGEWFGGSSVCVDGN
ncbi:MAG: type II secretion system protein [Patescibacteria group bacterium]|nr:type II secretion system protein [Patescibacteria group bacterium]